MAIDNENGSFMSPIWTDQVLVFDADNLTPLRPSASEYQPRVERIGTLPSRRRGARSGRERLRYRHAQLPGRGLRCRWQVHTDFGKHGDGPGYFAMLKALRWIAMAHLGADSMQNAFTCLPRKATADVDGQQAGRSAGHVFRIAVHHIDDKTNRSHLRDLSGRVRSSFMYAG